MSNYNEIIEGIYKEFPPLKKEKDIDGDKLMTLAEYNNEIKKIQEAEAAKKKGTVDLMVGDVVEYIGEDSYYKGTIVCIFTKLNGKSVRCVVENLDGLLLIKGLSNAKLYILGPNH